MDVFSPTPRNWEELEHPVNIFTPASRNKKKQEHPVDVFSPAPKIRNAGMFSEHFYPYAKNKDRK